MTTTRMLTLAAGLTLLTACPASAQRQRDYGIDFVTAGAPGNRHTIPQEVPWEPGWEVGAVDYEFRIARTMVTNTEYLEFVNAYKPYWEGVPWDSEFTGFWIHPDSKGEYRIFQGTERYAARISWNFAARYVNWLHNGKASERWAFEDGVYDTSTFYKDEDGWHHQLARHPDARYWIPSIDEWVKAAYHDPDRYGPGQEGYWAHPNGGDVPLVEGPPDQGGETAGYNGGEFGADIVRYPHVTSPWGLLDVSGTEEEWTEGISGNPRNRARIRGGTFAGMPQYEWWDRIDWWAGGGSSFASAGLRIAAPVPSPGALSTLLIGLLVTGSRRR